MHPLDPLGKEEIQQACDILKAEKSLESHHSFVYVSLKEPEQDRVINMTTYPDRIAFICLLDSKKNETYEADINLTTSKISRWEKLPFDKYPYGQAPILPGDYQKTEKIVKANAGWRDAMKKRGLSDSQIDLIQIDPFAPGYFDIEEEKGRRLVRAVSYYREKISDNGYARPIEGVVAVVDLTSECVLRVDDDALNTPIPKGIHNYDTASLGVTREAPKPLDITQPEGPSFKVNGWQVEWQGWRFRVGFNTREGLVLHNVTYQDQDRERSVLYRGSVVDMVVPYADPGTSHYFQAAFDSGENGFGRTANQLELGCDCLGYIHYFDVAEADQYGNARLKKQVICMHEEDAGPGAKHNDLRTGIYPTRRARDLLISYSTTIDNYDYVFYWRFCQNGSLHQETKLNGIVQTAATYPGMPYAWGGQLTQELAAPLHQHLFSVRLHMMVDGVNNTVAENECSRLPISSANPHGVAFGTKETVLLSEKEGARDTDASVQRSWKIFNSSMINSIGKPTAYKLELQQTPLLLADPNSFIYKRANFARHSLWVTKYHPAENYASGDYPNQHAGGAGVKKYSEQNRSIADTSIVLWATCGITHLPRPEDLPVMSSETLTLIKLNPFGFFPQNPAIGLPVEKNLKSVKQDGGCCGSTPAPVKGCC